MSKSNIDVVIHASSDHPASGIYQSYCQLLKQVGYSENDAPVADFLKHYYGLAGSWLIASPIHWEATHNDATIRQAETLLNLTEEESRYLFSIFADFIAQYNMTLYYHDAKTWLVHAPEQPIPSTLPVHLLVDKSMSPALKALEATPFWLHFMTECQMFFSAEKSIVNGIWLWGGNPLQSPRSSRPLIICGDEHWLNAAKQLSKTAVSCFDKKAPILKNSVYFVPNEHWMKASQLLQHLQNYTVSWHWENGSYKTKPKSWFSRLLCR